MNNKPMPNRVVRGHKVLNFENYCAYYLQAIATAMSNQASSLFISQLGIGIVEWRCLSVLAQEEDVSAARICELSNMSRPLVSRALKQLHSKGLVKNAKKKAPGKTQPLSITPKGYSAHDAALTISLDREKNLRTGLSEDEIRDFLRIAKIMLRNVRCPAD